MAEDLYHCQVGEVATMKHRGILLRLLAFALAACATSPPTLQPGQPAPAVVMTDIENRSFMLEEYRGRKNVLLVFYIGHR